jgi:hypothetical protein
MSAAIPPQIICTLYEGHYDYGVGSLINSLHRAGFAGTIFIGYRGAKPFWLDQCKASADGSSYRIEPGIELRLVLLATDWHFANYKPQFMLQVLRLSGSDQAQIFYFDPDIVVFCPWTFIREWAQDAVALVTDINGQFPSSHPLRLMWRRFFASKGLVMSHPRLEVYINSGFIGLPTSCIRSLPTSCIRMLDEWIAFQDQAFAAIGTHGSFHNEDRSYIFHTPDQDMLNAALERCDCPLSVIGSDGMDFVPGGYVMSHAIGQPKPWKKHFIRYALSGRPPTLQDKRLLGYIDQPLRLFSPGAAAWRRLSAKLAAMIGRVMRRY